MTRASGIVVFAQVAGSGWERRAGIGDVIARVADDMTRAGGSNVITQAADKAMREGGGWWCQARTREDGGRRWQTAKEEVWGEKGK